MQLFFKKFSKRRAVSVHADTARLLTKVRKSVFNSLVSREQLADAIISAGLKSIQDGDFEAIFPTTKTEE